MNVSTLTFNYRAYSNKYHVFSSEFVYNKRSDDNETLSCVDTVVAKNIHDKSILKWQRCKLRISTMEIILANQSMINELSHRLKNKESRHGKSPVINTVSFSCVIFSSS